MDDQSYFPRPDYAQAMARQLLQPTALQVQVRSGVFLSGIRRTGKTTFLRQDLTPALQAMGALVIYADLWADRSKNPASLVYEAVRSVLSTLARPTSSLMQRLKGVNVGAAGFSFGFQVDAVGQSGGVTLSQALTELVDAMGGSVVLIVDEVQQALGTDEGNDILYALKAARDAVNTRPGTPGYFLFIGTGSHKSLVADMAMRRTQPFAGAVASPFEPLGLDFIRWKRNLMADIPDIRLPSEQAMWQGFLTMGQRPEELNRALVQLQSRKEDPDLAFGIISTVLATAAVDTELMVLESFGTLATLVFDRIVRRQDGAELRLFSADALAEYSRRLGSSVDVPQVQNMLDRMIYANLVLRQSHGVYAPADPFVRDVWVQRAAWSQQMGQNNPADLD